MENIVSLNYFFIEKLIKFGVSLLEGTSFNSISIVNSTSPPACPSPPLQMVEAVFKLQLSQQVGPLLNISGNCNAKCRSVFIPLLVLFLIFCMGTNSELCNISKTRMNF